MNTKEVKEYWSKRCNFKITDQKVKRLFYAFQNGSTKKLAAAYAGITVNTLNNWLRHGEALADQLEAGLVELKENEIFYLELWVKISAIETQIQIDAFNQIQEAAKFPENWRAAVEILKMRFGNEYNPNRQNDDSNGAVKEPFFVAWMEREKNQEDSNNECGFA